MSDSMSKQQQIVLEIFEKQNEGVIIFQKEKDADVPDRKIDEARHETIHYTNKAYRKMIGSEHEFESINIPFLTVKPEESNLLQPNIPIERQLYSIKDLVHGPNDFISKNVFSHQMDPQVSKNFVK